MAFRPVRTSQPQGSVTLDRTSPLLAGKPLVVLSGGNPNNLVTGQPLTVVGTDSTVAKPSGLTHANNNTGEIGATIEALGTNDYVDFWVGHAFWDTSKEAFYIIGDYTGAAGTGVYVKHAQNSNNAGIFNGTGLVNSGFLVTPWAKYCFVLVKKAGVLNLYIDGLLRASNSAQSPGQANWSVGNIGLNQGAGFRTPAETLLAGRIGYAAWTPQQVKSFTDNPWQIFAPDSKALWTPAAASVSLPTLVQPSSTTSAGAWTATGAATLHDAINELVPSDTQYISVNSASTTELALAEAAFPGAANQTLAYRASSTQGSTLTVTLKQGATQIMTRTHALTGIDTLYTQTLTSGEIALITAGPISVTLTTS